MLEKLQPTINHLINLQCDNEDSKVYGLVYRWGGIVRHGDPYPEITGYFMTSFCRLYDLTKNQEYLSKAKNAANSLISFQEKNGAIPTLIDGKGNYEKVVHLFDLAIIARGILDVYDRTLELKYLDAAKKAISFIEEIVMNQNVFSVVDFNLQPIKKYTFPELFWINTKAIIPLYLLSFHVEENRKKELLACAIHISNQLLRFQQSDGGFRLDINSPYNRTHYHAYAVYGIMHLYKWTADSTYLDVVKKGTDWLINCQDNNGGIFTYSAINGSPEVTKGYDVPVSAQLAELCCFFEQEKNISEIDKDKYQAARITAESFLVNIRYNCSYLKYLHGGLPFMTKESPKFFTVPWGELFWVNYIHDLNGKKNEQI